MIHTVKIADGAERCFAVASVKRGMTDVQAALLRPNRYASMIHTVKIADGLIIAENEQYNEGIMEYVIYYYSGTGNSLAVARRAAARLNAPEPIAITAEFLMSIAPQTSDTTVERSGMSICDCVTGSCDKMVTTVSMADTSRLYTSAAERSGMSICDCVTGSCDKMVTTASTADTSRLYTSAAERCQAVTCLQASDLNRVSRVLIVFPSYAYGLPAPVSEFFKRFAFPTKDVAIAVTYGSAPGGTLAAARCVLKRRGISVRYAAAIPSVENFIPIFGAVKEKHRLKRLKKQRARTEKLLDALVQDRKNHNFPIRPASVFVSKVFRLATPMLSGRMKVSDACNGCGVCARCCPMGAIKLESERPVIDGKTCSMCQACINVCPTQAISLWRHKRGVRQYRNPEVQPKDLYKR